MKCTSPIYEVYLAGELIAQFKSEDDRNESFELMVKKYPEKLLKKRVKGGEQNENNCKHKG